MVLEQIIKIKVVEKKKYLAFLMGVAYSIIGIIFARIVFAGNSGLMAVAFIAILLLPSLSKFLLEEENAEIREKKLSLKMLFKDHKDIFEIYFFMFLGIFMTFAIIAAFFPMTLVTTLFGEQLHILSNYAGHAFSLSDPTWSIMLNNLKIVLVMFVMSFVYGSGGILLIAWNASVWGAIFGYIVNQSAHAGSGNPFWLFIITILPVLPHMVIEVVSYFMAAVSGGVLSKATLREKFGSTKFHHVLTDGLIMVGIAVVLVIIGAIVETQLFPLIFNLFS